MVEFCFKEKRETVQKHYNENLGPHLDPYLNNIQYDMLNRCLRLC